jgi:GAF domain-containing protein
VVGVLGLQFYAAAPLRTKDGYNLGTFCIIDKHPRTLSAEQNSMLRQLARIVMGQLELRLQSRILLKEFKEKNETREI